VVFRTERGCYDRAGRRLSRQDAAAALVTPLVDRTIAFDRLRNPHDGALWQIVTLHVVLDQAFEPADPPLIYETLVCPDVHPEHVLLWPTEADAATGHDRVVHLFTGGRLDQIPRVSPWRLPT
jgi:hypothetical protein